MPMLPVTAASMVVVMIRDAEHALDAADRTTDAGADCAADRTADRTSRTIAFTRTLVRAALHASKHALCVRQMRNGNEGQRGGRGRRSELNPD